MYYLVSLLPEGLRPYAKALLAALVPLLLAVVNGVFTGAFDMTELKIAAVGIVTALFVFQTPNLDQQPVEGRPTPSRFREEPPLEDEGPGKPSL